MTTQWKWYRYILLVAFLSLLMCTAYAIYNVSLQPTRYFTGWLLALTIAFLTLYNVGKKLPVLPFWSVSVWLRLHLSIVWLPIVLFPLHTEFRVPQGTLEVTLSIFFLVTILSGFLGILMEKILPPRINTHGESILFERIPQLRRQVRENMEALVLRSVEETNSEMIVDYYRTRLDHFFQKPRNFVRHVTFSHRPFQKMMEQNEFMDRYANAAERKILEEIAVCIRKKNRLDLQYSLQMTLKSWFFTHIAITYGMLVFAVLHVLVAYTFYGGF